jgi:hypothetical protein
METISVELAKWLLIPAGVAICSLAGFIVKLIASQKKDLSDARTEWKTQCDEEITRLTDIIVAEKADKLVLVEERNAIQREYLEFVKHHHDHVTEE